MEASRGPQPSVSHLKGATLPGYRVGPFRSSSQASSIARRSSDGDVAESKLVRGDKCRKYEPRFWVSYKSESPSGESGTITSEPKEPSSSWESPDLAPQFSSRPTITPLAAPASPRPQVRRSFNTFPRPWKARSRSPSPFRTKEQMNKSSSDTLHFRSFNDSLNLAKYPSGAKREDEVNKYKGGQQVENISRSSEMAVIRPVPFYAKPHPHERDGTENPIPNVYRSVATITVTKSPQSPTSPPPNLPLQHPNEKYSFIHTHIREENPTRKLTSLLNSLTSRRLANKESRAEAKLVADEAKEKKLVESLYEVISEAKEKEREKRQEQQQKLMPHAPSQPPQATKISSSASLLPCVPDEHGSAPLPCDEENCALHRVSERASRQSAFDKEEFDDAQLVHDLRSNEVINTEEDSHFEKASVSSGGSGPGDREAPLSGLNAQSLMQASGRKSVRKKPQIPDKLSRRRCSEDGDQRNEVELVAGSLLSPSHSFSSADTYRAKEISPASTLQPVKSHSIPPTRTSTADKHELTKSRTTVSQILSTLNFARFRLEELTGALGGTKKNGGKGSLSPGGRSPPPKPLRMRHDLEKLKKSTERLKKSGTSDYETDSSVKDSLSQPTKPKIRGKSETSSKHIFFPKQAIARTNSSPAGVSRVSSSSLLSSLSGKLLNNENKNGDSFSSSTSSNFMLPPLPKQKPSPESRNISCSSSVSHADLSKEKDNGEASSTLKLYSTCQEPWGYHTLPRCRTSIQNTITASQDLGQNQEQIPYVSSLHDFGKLNLECSEGKENLIAKSKCEMAFQYPQNDVADLALQLSSVPKLAAESKGELESNITFSQAIEEGSIIKRLLQSDFSGHGNDSAVVCFPEAVEENNQQSRGRTLPLELNRMKLNFDVISNHKENSSHDVMKSNQFDECISEVIFEKELLEKNSNSEYIRQYKDISVQTDKNLTKEMDKYKKSRLKENRARSVDDKREKLRLWIENKSFDSGIPDNENCPKLEDTPNLPDLKYRSDDNRTKDVVTEINIVHCGADNGHQKSQSFGMPSSNFDELKAGEEINRGHEPSAISNKSGEVQMHQRVSLEYSEGESQDKEHKLFPSRSEGSDEQEPIEGIFCNPPTEFSDSSPQHNFGVHFNKTRSVKLQHPLQEASKYEERAEKSDSRKRKNHPDEGFEEDPTKRDESPCENSPSSKTTKHMKKQENLRKFNWHCDQQRSMKNDLSLSDGDSRPNSYSEPESLQLVVTSDPNTEKRDTKKKNRSDPGFKRARAEDIVGYFSDSNLEAFEGGKMRANDDEKSQLSRSAGPGYRVVSQASTDSEGRDELGASKGTVHDLFRHSRSQTPRFSNPPVIMSGESDASCQDISSIEYSGNRNISRNASPSPYLGDSDSGERCFVRSPHTPRRYSKRPLRGPYGEMLEAEMSKSKSTSQFLSDDLFLRPRECNSTSPRPSSPASPSAASAKIHDPFETSPPLFLANVNSPSRSPTHSTSRSLDDSTLKLFYSDIAGKKGDHLTRPENVAYPSYESDGEVGLTTLPTGPLHQRTASSPSKLFFEPVSITKEERNLSTFPATRIPPKPRSQTPPNEEKTKVLRTASSETSPKPKAKLPKSKPDRHSKSTKGKKHPEEETRVHFSSQQPPKKGPHETEFRPHGDHRHLHRRYRVSTH